MKNLLRIGMLLCSFLLASVGWAMAEENDGGTNGITTLEALKNAIESGTETEITLGSDIENVSEAITISRALTLNGNGKTISGSVSSDALLKITGTGEVTINNLTVANNTKDRGSEIYVKGSDQEGSSATVVSFQNTKLSGTSEVGIAAECHVNISIENVQETSPHQIGIQLAGSAEQLKASLEIKGTNNTFNQCIMPIQIYNQDQATVTSEDDSFVKLPGSGDETYGTYWTDRYKSTKIYTISTTGRTSASYSQELALLSNCIAADTENAYQKITLGAGEYALSSQLTINKAITLEGAGSGEDGTKIIGQIDIVSTDESSKDIVFKNLAIEGTTGINGLLNVMTANVDLLLDGVTLHQKSNYTQTDSWNTTAKGIAICNPAYNSTDNPDNISITMKQSSILMDGMYNRGICYAGSDTDKPNGIKLTLIDSDITAKVNPQNATYGRGISLYGLQAPELSLSNSKVQGFYYPVNLSMNEAAKVTIENRCVIQGYAALNIHDPNGNYEIKNSSLIGRNYYPKGSSDFATIVLDRNAKNNTLVFEDASLSNLQENTALEYIFSIRDNGNSIALKGNTTLKSTTDVTPYLFDVYSNVTYNLSIEPTVSFKDKDDNDCILIYDSQNTFKNAVTSFTNLLTSGVLAANDIIKLPALTYALESPLSFDVPFTIEGAGIDQTIFKAATKGESAVTGQNLITLNGSGANGTTIKNLTIQNANNYGLHVYQAENITLENIELKDNLAGGMFVNGSKVTATGIQTSGNVWGGIEVGKGKDVTTDPKLMISNSTLLESTQIWADTNAEKNNSAISGWVNAEGYSSFEYQPEGKTYKQTFWANRQQITIKVDKTTFIKEEGKTYQLTYTTTPANIEGITVKYCTKSGENYQEVSGDITEVGTYYVFFTRPADSQYAALNEMVVMTITNKSVPTISTPATLQETVLEAGLPLSMYHLIPGKAVVDETEVIGTYSWADGNQVLTEGENTLTYIFTPANLAEMDIVTGTINATAKRYFTVKTGVSANGKAAISNKSASDRYENNSRLSLIVTPDEGYTFTGWKDLGNSSLTYTVTEDKELVAKFAKKQFTVTFSQPENGSLSVKNGSATVNSGTKLDYGTILTVAVSANLGYTAEAITTTGSALVKGEIFLDANTTITATLATKPATPKKITVTQPIGGTIRLTNKETGKEIVAGSEVADGTVIIIERTPNKGYKLADGVKAREEKTINADVTIEASFDQVIYTVTASTGTGYTLIVSKISGLIYGEEVYYTSSLSAGYKGIAMMVNEKEVPADGSFIVTGDMKIEYIVKEKATLSIPNEDQSYVYNGRAQAFVVKTTPAGLTNVNVTYKKAGIEVGTPTDAGEYDVLISRAEDENYKAFSETRTLTITKAPVIITNRPSDANGANGAASVAGTWRSGAKPENPVKPILRSETQYAIFTPSSENYAEGYCMPGSSMDMKVTISSTTNGTISVWDGNLQITNSTGNNAIRNSELTIYATPAVGYKLTSLKIDDAVLPAQPDGSFKVTPSSNITVSAEFKAKETLSPTISGVDDLVYDGTVKTATISATGGVTKGWNYSVQQNGITVSPINAGTYDVLITREEDGTYQAYRQLHSGALVINKATLSTSSDIIAPSATVLKGALLSTAALSGGASTTDGTFVWENPNETFTSDGTANMKFIPSDAANFNEVSGISVTVNVTDVQAVTFTQPEHATLTVKRGETVLQSGDVIENGDVLTITATPENGYTLESLKVNGSNFSNGGTYTVADGATVMIVATVKEYVAPVIPGGGGTVDPDPVIPTVSNPVVAERTATTAAITWEKVSGATSYKLFLYAKKTDSTPLKTYEFDKDGKLKATTISFTLTGLEEGKSYYIETAAYNALGTLLVKKSVELSATPTGIEAISEGSQLYTVKGAIVVAPAEPLQVAIYSVTGQTLFNDEVSYLTQVPAKAGIYVVVIQKGKDRITEKVFVK